MGIFKLIISRPLNAPTTARLARSVIFDPPVLSNKLLMVLIGAHTLPSPSSGEQCDGVGYAMLRVARRTVGLALHCKIKWEQMAERMRIDINLDESICVSCYIMVTL